MAIKINTAYKEILTSTMLNEKISGVIGGNEKVNGFDVSISASTSVMVKPGKAYVNGCSIEETTETKTIPLNSKVLSVDGIVYVVLAYIHETKNVEFSCVKEVSPNMVKLATLTIKNGAITELVNHEAINTLNTVVGASADVEAQKIRDMIPSGFIELGQLDYAFMLNNENKVKMQGKSVAYVNGYRVEIPADTIIDIGKAPAKESREDLLFLEAWKDSDFSKSGKLKWRIRLVADVNFNNTSFVDGLAYQGGTLDSALYTKLAFPQGGNIDPLSYSDYSNDNERFTGIFRVASLSTYDWQKTPYVDDKGLFLSKLSKNKTVDGYVYAIPMFKLHRKPSCGKSIPFEYSNINPKADYSKFTKLMREERVERVISESIKGISVVNLLKTTSYTGANNIIIDKGILLKANTTYTIIANPKCNIHNKPLLLLSPSAVQDSDLSTADNAHAKIVTELKGKEVYAQLNSNFMGTFTTTANSIYMYVRSGGRETPDFKYSNLMILEGDWTNKKAPTFFTGLKSLGEDDRNLITIKNAILSEDSYDINDGNQKLKAFPGVTYVDSTNLLTPKVEAIVKKDRQQAPLEKLRTQLNTAGDEIIEFTKIKGVTMQNCYPAMTRNAFALLSGSVDNGYIVLQGLGTTYANAFIRVNQCVIKPNTKYTMVVDVAENTLKQDFRLATNHAEDVFSTGSDQFVKILSGKIGTYKYLVTSARQITNQMFGLRSFLNTTETGKIKFKIMLLEGDYTNTTLTDIPYFEGIASVGENEVIDDGKHQVKIKSFGKNLCNNKFVYDYAYNGTTGVVTPYANRAVLDNTISFKANEKLYFNIKQQKEGATYYIRELYLYDVNGCFKERLGSLFNNSVITMPNYDGVIGITVLCRQNGSTTEVSFKDNGIEMLICRSDVSIPYEPYKEYNQNIHLREPLRSLPHKVHDEIAGNKVIRKIGKKVLNGSNSDGIWSVVSGQANNDTMLFQLDKIAKSTLNAVVGCVCDTLPSASADVVWDKNTSFACIAINFNGYLQCRVPSDLIASGTVSSFKTWLSQNPVTVYYELETPVEECLENVYEKESIKTYQLDAPLRGIANGAADEIRDGMLIRRCGEALIDSSNTKISLRNNGNETTTISFQCTSTNGIGKSGTRIISSNFPHEQNPTNGFEGIGIGASGETFVEILRSRLSSSNLAGFIQWLQDNPIKLVYELTTPIITPLKEAHVADFTPKRQFAEGRWLRELSDSVKDIVSGDKVIRKIGKVTVNGSENGWVIAGEASKFAEYKPAGAPSSLNSFRMLSDKLPNVTISANNAKNPVGISATHHGAIRIRPIDKDALTMDDVRAWLAKSPITILYELTNPTEEPLAADNCMYYPNHEFNTYYGSMYVGDGRNNVINDSKIPSGNPAIIETDFRRITDRARVGDCRYKKCDDGYNTLIPQSKTINLLPVLPRYMEVGTSTDVNNLTWEQAKEKAVEANSRVRLIHTIPVKSSTPYIVTTNSAIKVVVKEFNEKGIGIKDIGWVDPPYKFTTLANTHSVAVMFKKASDARITLEEVEAVKAMLCKGSNTMPFTSFEVDRLTFENIKENDVTDLRHLVSLTGFDYMGTLQKNFDLSLKGKL